MDQVDTPPEGFHLLEHETLLSVTQHTLRRPKHHPSSLQQMLRLTKARNPEEIGVYGPSLAAIAFETSDLVDTDDTPEHLRLYETVFGRDSLRVAIDSITGFPALARATLIKLAELQGVTNNTEREEEPGRIVHEARSEQDIVAAKISAERGWGWPYYGSVDATPEFIRTLTAYCKRSEENAVFLSETYSDRMGEIRTMSHALELALQWIENRLNSNAEGLLEYKTILPGGIENQVWKDSPDAYHHADGTIANHNDGIASIEVQVTTYDALIDAAELYEDILDQPQAALRLREKADILRHSILRYFWTHEKGGYFVLGTDRDDTGRLRQLKVRTSNMGHALNSRLLKGDEPHIVHMREAIVAQIQSPELQTRFGIRTLASDEVRFRPGAYHNGSIWLWDTHHIAKGLRRLGYVALADTLDQKILRVINETRIFPEYIRGDDSEHPSINLHTIIVWDEQMQKTHKVEQPPQEVQAWTVAAILATKLRIARRKQNQQPPT